MLYPWPKIDIRKSLKLFNKLHTYGIRNILRKHQAVYKQFQLSVGKITVQIEVGENTALNFFTLFIFINPQRFAVFNIIPELNQIHKISLNWFPVSFHIIFVVKNFNDFLLNEPVIFVSIFLENIKNIHNQQLFLLHSAHTIISVMILTFMHKICNNFMKISAKSTYFSMIC